MLLRSDRLGLKRGILEGAESKTNGRRESKKEIKGQMTENQRRKLHGVRGLVTQDKGF